MSFNSKYAVAAVIGGASYFYPWMLPSFAFYTVLSGAKQDQVFAQLGSFIAGRVLVETNQHSSSPLSFGTTTLG